VLIDAAAYFSALARAIDEARREIFMLGWDFHSRLRLERESDDGPTLVERLDAAVRRRPELRVRILEWDWALLYAFERELWPTYRFDVGTHPRIEFALDDRHPVGASHHQKVVVVDDRVAFSGGIDLTVSRWDTPEHLGRDPRRDEEGAPDDGPFHDVQMLVEGDAARALGDLARERWRRATGRKVRPAASASSEPWPSGLEADFEDVQVAVARTIPAMRRTPEVREVECSFIDSIEAARSVIYLENQYFTSRTVADALARRLAEGDGPEVVLVLPETESGWLEESTMGMLRAGAISKLQSGDRWGRLRVVHPVVPGLEDRHFTLHAKLAVVDDRLLRVGSANLSNRSMGFDTECDLLVDAALAGDPDRTRTSIARVRDSLLAEHLGRSVDDVQAAIARHDGALVPALDELASPPSSSSSGEERRLERLEVDDSSWVQSVLPDDRWLDPDRPLIEPVASRAASQDPEPAKGSGTIRAVLTLLVLVSVPVALAAAWRWWVPESQLEPAELARSLSSNLGSWARPWTAPLLFAAGSLAMLPVTALAAATGLVFAWPVAIPVAFTGSLLGALAGFAAGRQLGQSSLTRLAGRHARRLERWLANRGALSVAGLRLVPVAPFQVVNALAGATTVRFRDYALGSALGLVPGSVLMPLLADRSLALADDFSWTTATTLAGVVLLAIAARGAVTRWVGQRFRGGSGSGSR
jgi:phosphatidylserine/phosphatidylglycerophosphate/cardiolipin synthase-like enzyme/uncharacterized membrane protein YdjX (TVP38/TMEM64 family)